MLIDTHAHLNDSKYNENREELISSLFSNNVEKVFTVAYNKQSILDSIEGIGQKRKEELLKKYKTTTQLKKLPVEELGKTLPKKVAENLYNFLNSDN